MTLYVFAGYPPMVDRMLQPFLVEWAEKQLAQGVNPADVLPHAGESFEDYAIRVRGGAGLLRHWIQLHELGVLVEDPKVSYQKEGVFVNGVNTGPVRLGLSPSLQSIDLTLDSFLPTMTFGNGTTCNARVGLSKPLPKLAQYRTGKFRQKRYSRNIWLSWCVMENDLPDEGYAALLQMMEG